MYTISNHKVKVFDDFIKKKRRLNKINENKNKLSLKSPDILNTKDFIFSKKTGIERIGDSGELLLAYKKEDKTEKYILKHEYTDCACNEFVYSKLARAMDIKVPEVKLFTIDDEEKRKYFKTEYICGIEFLNIVKKEEIDLNFIIKSDVHNWKDYFAYISLYSMFDECDSFEVVLTENNYIYKIDNSASFSINNFLTDFLGINYEFEGININLLMEQKLGDIIKNFKYNKYFSDEIISNISNCGKEYFKYYLEPLEKIQEVKKDYVDDFLNVLCYIYPDSLGEFYKQYIDIIQQKSWEFMENINNGLNNL